jgi:hypothetical protein
MDSAPENSKLLACSGVAEIVSAPSADPNPTKLFGPIELDSVERHRRFLCHDYGRCLEEAARQSWPSWSCENCQMFALEAPLHAIRLDHEALGRPDAEF